MLMRNLTKIFWLAFAMTVYGAPLAAAPFCVETQGVAPSCIYVDATQCRLRAEQLKGQCVPNPDEMALATGTGKYCTVDSSRVVQCLYADRTSCENEARKQGAACIESVPKEIQKNPYQLDPNRKY